LSDMFIPKLSGWRMLVQLEG